jgi:hypothetical protein
MSCRTCHYPETDEQGRRVFPQRVASAEPVGRAQLVRFAACDVCHGHDGWAPEKKSWHVDGHGVGAWACFKCHEGKTDASGKLALATVQVTDHTGISLEFWRHSHPGLTSSDPALADPTQIVNGEKRQCRDCHIANVITFPPRPQSKSFVHDPHVPGSPTADNCLSCHESSGQSRRSEDRPGVRSDRCWQCHPGAGLTWRISSPRLERTVPQFDHAGHVHAASLVPGEKGIGCVECHTKGGKLCYETPADVLSCTKCHGHEGDKAKRTGPKTSQGDATKCLFCHDKVRGEENGVVGAPPRETITRSHLDLLDGVQHHDKTGDCAACHVREGAAAAPYEERIRSARVQLSIHEDPKFADRPFNDPKGDCAVCHRTPPRGYLRSLLKR